MDISYHNKDLISIRILALRESFFKLLSYFDLTKVEMFLILSRPNFKFAIPNDVEIAYKESDDFQCIIKLKNSDLMLSLKNIEWAWERYEFFQLLLINNKEKINTTRIFQNSPEKNSNLFDGISIHKGIEEDVLWISKSKKLYLTLFDDNVPK